MAWLAGFTKRKPIRYGTVFPASNLSDFPLLVKTTGDDDIADELASGGGIAVTGPDGETVIPMGLYSSSDLADGDVILRLKTGLLTAASTGDVIGYLYFDGGHTTANDYAGVVSNGYVLFMPLEEDPSGTAPQMFDWATETYVGTSHGDMTSGDLVAGPIGSAIDFDGTDDYITVPMAHQSAPLTMECLFWRTGESSIPLVYLRDSGVAFIYFALHTPWQLNPNPVYFVASTGAGAANASTTGPNLAQSTWHYAAGVAVSATDRTAYANGADPGSNTASRAPTNIDTLFIGAANTGGGFLPGRIAEVRLSSTDRSADWIAYTHANDFTPTDTVTLGPLEEMEPPTPSGAYSVAGYGGGWGW